MKKRLSLLLVIILTFGFMVNVKAASEDYSISPIEKYSKDYTTHSIKSILVPYAKTKLDDNTEKFINNYQPKNTTVKEEFVNIMEYIRTGGYSYNVNGKALEVLKNKKGRCYEFAMLTAKLLEKTNIPYKTILMVARDSNGKYVTGHTTILFKDEEGNPRLFESTWASADATLNPIYSNHLERFNFLYSTTGVSEATKVLTDVFKQSPGYAYTDIYTSEWLNNGVKVKERKEIPRFKMQKIVNGEDMVYDFTK